MSGRGRPVGPEGRVSASQVMLDERSRRILDTSDRGGSSMLRQAIRLQAAQDFLERPQVVHNPLSREQMAIVRDLHRNWWRVVTPTRHFLIRTTTDPQDPRGPVYAVVEGAMFAPVGMQAVQDALNTHPDLVRLYVVTDRFVSVGAKPDDEDTYRLSVMHVHAQPGTLLHFEGDADAT